MLLVVGVGLALLGMLVVDAAIPEAAVATDGRMVWAGALMCVTGYVLTLVGLVRWSLRTYRATSVRAVERRTAASAAV